MRRFAALGMLFSLLCLDAFVPSLVRAQTRADRTPESLLPTATPIKHLVVIFDENNSFDHYFGTYPNALNLPGETHFQAAPDTPAVNGLTPTLLTKNPNASNPVRMSPAQASTCDNINKYLPEQQAFDGGLLDRFDITSVGAACGTGFTWFPNLAMGYYDGNTVTGLWNYAQNFAMSDNFFDSEFGGTVEGHLNLLSGQTNGLIVKAGQSASSTVISNNSVINNVDPISDDCGGSAPNVSMTGNNIGNLLNNKSVTWGWFYDGFARTGLNNGVATCNSLYNSHYAPFQYYPSTSNPHHTPPTSPAVIGYGSDAANHNYDYSNLSDSINAGHLPSVTFIKAAKPNTGHPMDSTPLEEQAFLVNTINALMASPFWQDMAILIAYDDSDGWYDHVAAPVVNHSTDSANDAIQGTAGTNGSCGALTAGADNDRCGFGVRLPFLAISPFAKRNFVDHSLNDTTSIMRFIEYNWGLGTLGSLGIANDNQSYDVLASGSILGMFQFDSAIPPQANGGVVILDPTTGQVLR
jgi:phospholipase C